MDPSADQFVFARRSGVDASRRKPAWALLVVILAGGLCNGCSRKLSHGGNAMEVLSYDILKMDRGTGYYFQTLQDAHDRTNFSYRASDDPFLADKCVDAIRHLGDAKYDRLEGEVQVVLLLSDVLLEDPIIFAKIQAADALTKLAISLPIVPTPDRPERGDRYLAVLKELDGMHDAEGRRRVDTPATRARVATLFDEIGSYRFPKLLDTKNGLRFFPARRYVTGETDPVLREAIDRAMVRRARAVVTFSLTDAVQESSSDVRTAALRGLRTLAVVEAIDSVIERIAVESSGLVRVAIADYLGAVGGPDATRALVGLLDDDDASVRHHAHEGLFRVSGRDLGRDSTAWVAYAEGRPLPIPASVTAPPAPMSVPRPDSRALPSALPPPIVPTSSVPTFTAPSPAMLPPMLPPTSSPPLPPYTPPPPPEMSLPIVPTANLPAVASERTGPAARPGELPPPSHRVVEGR